MTGGDIVLFGQTPTEQEVRGLAEWISQQDNAGPVFATDRLTQLYPPAATFSTATGGLMAARLLHSRPDFVMWFRSPIMQSIAWAGDPNKPAQVDVVDGQQRLTPRVSFEIWKEEVQDRSKVWLACEVEAASALRQVIAEVALVRLNEALLRSNDELDSFAYVASHDLKEPLRGIHNFARFLQQSADPKLSDEERSRIQTIIRLTRRMDDLTDALILYSRVGQLGFSIESVDVDELLQNTLILVAPRVAETRHCREHSKTFR